LEGRHPDAFCMHPLQDEWECGLGADLVGLFCRNCAFVCGPLLAGRCTLVLPNRVELLGGLLHSANRDMEILVQCMPLNKMMHYWEGTQRGKKLDRYWQFGSEGGSRVAGRGWACKEAHYTYLVRDICSRRNSVGWCSIFMPESLFLLENLSCVPTELMTVISS